MDTMTMDMDTMTMGMDTMMMDVDTMTMDTTMTDMVVGGQLSIALDSSVVINTCSGDELSDLLEVDLVGAAGDSLLWLITDVAGLILDLPEAPPFELDSLVFDTCLIWNLSFNGQISGVEIDSLISDIQGDFGLSNAITAFKTVVDGGNISGGLFSFCVEDGLADQVPNLMLSDNRGDLSQWVITDTALNVVALPQEITTFDFDIFAPGEYRVFNLSSSDSLIGLQNGNSINDILGCFDTSNSISVLSQNSGAVCDTLEVTSNGGVIAAANADDVSVPLCAGDEIPNVIDFTLTGNIGQSSVWIISDDQNIITELPGDPPFDFEGFGNGISRVWHLSSNGGISGLGLGLPLSGLDGDFDLSNAISVNHLGVDGGTIDGFEFEFCVDGSPDIIPELVISDTVGPNIQLFINDLNGFIVATPDDISEVDFDVLPAGDYFVNVISYIDTSTRVAIGDNRVNFEGCFDLSNAIVIDRASPDGGTLVGNDMAFCIDGVSDFPVGISVTESSGPNDAWVITDEQGNIIDIPVDIDSVDFEVLGVGTCFIYNVSFEDGITGLAVMSSLSDLMGCYDLSDSIVVSKNIVAGGDIDGGPFEFCVDNNPDFVSDIIRSNNFGDSSQWIVTDADSIVIAIIADITTFDFNADISQNFIFSVTFSSPTTMIDVGTRVDLLEGCLDISNAIAVNKRTSGEGCNDGDGIAVMNEINESFIEIRNIGEAPIDITNFWLGQSPVYERIGDLTFDCTDDFIIEPGELISIEMDEIEIDGIDGELALFTVDSFESSNAIIDYVEWGSINHPNANLAVEAGIWSDNTVAESFVGDVSLSYDGLGDLGTDWFVEAPSPCGDNVETSVVPDWEIHGNPASEFVMVEINENSQLTFAEMEIHSIHGDFVKSYSQSLTKNNNRIRIDIADLPNGIYLLVMRGQTTKQIERFIKQ